MIKNKLQIIMTIGWIFLISIFMAIAVYALTTTKELKFFAGIKYDPTIIVDVYINDNLVFSSRAPGEVNQDYIDNIVNDTINFNSNIIAGETYNIRIVNCDTQKDILYTINNNGELSGVIEKNNGTNSNEATEVITITETGLGQTLFSIKLEILYDLKDLVELVENDDETWLNFGELGTIKNITGKTFYVSDINGLLNLSALVGKVNTITKYDSELELEYGYDNSAGPAVTFEGATIQMLNEIDCGNTSAFTNAKTFIPIGNSSNSFQGTFDGNNKTIKGLYIEQEADYAGLFGYVSNAEIKDLTMQNCKVVSTGNYVGNFVGRADNSSISNCSADCSADCSAEETAVSGPNCVGGIVGYAKNATITNCYNTGNISGDYNISGIVGYISDGEVTIEYCYNEGVLKGLNHYVAGIVGRVFSGTTVITNCYNVGSINGYRCVGGILAYVDEGATISISNCYNNGNVSGSKWIAGIVGYVVSVATITYCHNSGNVSSVDGDVGGIVGICKVTDGVVNILNCYNTHQITGGDCGGGIIGLCDNGTINVFNNFNVGTVEIDSYYVGGIIGSSNNGKIYINNCYHIGNIVDNGSNLARGGILGYIWSADVTVKNSFCSNSYKVIGNAENANSTSYYGTFSSASDNVVQTSSEDLVYIGNILDVLNAYIEANSTYNGIDLKSWVSVNGGYPVFA